MRRLLLLSLCVGTLILLWWIGFKLTATQPGGSPVADPVNVALVLHERSSYFLTLSFQTATQAIVGLLLASLICSLAITIVSLHPRTEPIVTTYFSIAKGVPVVALVPLIVALVGMGVETRIAVSLLICLFPLYVGALDGLARIPEELRQERDVFHVRDTRWFAVVGWRYALSGLLVGLQTAAPLSVVGSIVGEYVGGGIPRSLGSMLIAGIASDDMVAVYALTVCAAITGVAFYESARVIAVRCDSVLRISRI